MLLSLFFFYEAELLDYEKPDTLERVFLKWFEPILKLKH